MINHLLFPFMIILLHQPHACIYNLLVVIAVFWLTDNPSLILDHKKIV
jgi:hypothetical protein